MKPQSLARVRPDAPSIDSTTAARSGSNVITLDAALCGRALLSLPDMQRHTIAFGESGSGKTVTVLAPLAKSFLGFGDQPANWAAVVLIDPKRELRDLARTLLASRGQSSRLMEVGDHPFDLFEGLEGHSPAQRAEVLLRLVFEIPSSGDNAMWINMARSLFVQLVRADAAWYAAKKHRDDECLYADLAGMDERAEAAGSRLATYMTLLQSVMQRNGELKKVSSQIRLRLVDAGVPASLDPLVNYTADGDLVRQFAYLVQLLDPTLRALSSPDLCPVLDCDPVRVRKTRCRSIGLHLAAGGVVLYQPPATAFSLDRLVGRALKAVCFRHVFARTEARPLAYICDEFHRYITADEDSGEQNFLDRCRAFGVSCVLATQSIAALKTALLQQECSAHQAEVVIQSILNNTATKYFLRTTDLETRSQLRSMLPEPPRAGMRHVIEARPPVTLATGEAYYFFPDGTAGRSLSPASKEICDLLAHPSVPDDVNCTC